MSDSANFSSHIHHIVTRASARANLIHKCFLSKDISTLTRAFIVYVRPLEYASVVWSPYLVKDIRQVESVQRRFTKRLSGMSNLTYSEHLASLGLESLELRRLLQDLVCTYKILSTELNTNHALLTRAHSLMYVDAENFLTVNSSSQMRGHMYKLYKP